MLNIEHRAFTSVWGDPEWPAVPLRDCVSIAVTIDMSVRMHQRGGAGVDIVIAGPVQRHAGVSAEVCARGVFGVVLLQACGGVLQDWLQLLRVLRLSMLLRCLVG